MLTIDHELVVGAGHLPLAVLPLTVVRQSAVWQQVEHSTVALCGRQVAIFTADDARLRDQVATAGGTGQDRT